MGIESDIVLFVSGISVIGFYSFYLWFVFFSVYYFDLIFEMCDI